MICPAHLDTHVRLLFQRQWRHPSAVELLFDEVIAFHLAPAPENRPANIDEAKLFIDGGTIYWAADCSWQPESGDRDKMTWIAARRLRWRDASAWMGEPFRYGPRS